MSTAADIGEQLRVELARARNGLALEIDTNLRVATPIVTGHAMNNWVPSVDTPFTDEVDDDAAHTAGIADVVQATIDQLVFVSNNAPYIGKLIGGSSTQAPAGWDVAAIDKAVETMQTNHDRFHIDVSK